MSFKNIAAQDFKKIQEENPNVRVLDVRTPAEVGQGKIPGAINLDVSDRSFVEGIHKLEKDKTYLLYCRSGARSAQACGYMAQQDFSDLYNLSGGILGWPYDTE